MTLEIIIFILAILFGIILYWSESKSNRIYKFINRLTHNEELQMKAGNRKGFVHKQPFLMRLVYVTLLFVIAGIIVQFVTPINAFYIQYFASAIVGTLIGTYLASAVLFAKESTSKETLEKTFEKGKSAVEEFTEDLKDRFEKEEAPETELKQDPNAPTNKKSARDKFKDKGMIK